ncbi:MAG TPA: superoxide dismutase [Niabella sp.]
MNNRFTLSRRQFIRNTGMAGLAAGIHLNGYPSGNKDIKTGWKQSPLPYAYNALEPVIDAQTMELHYSRHAATYAKNLEEAAQQENIDTSKMAIEDVLANVSRYSLKLRNNAGGHYNHEFFWRSLRPQQESNQPGGALGMSIQKDFNSFEAFQKAFNNAAATRFGSGWAWLIYLPGGKLMITSTANQDNPLMDISGIKGIPVLGLDVWEHAYYLKYQNKRPDYIAAWWELVNWNFIESRFTGLQQ